MLEDIRPSSRSALRGAGIDPSLRATTARLTSDSPLRRTLDQTEPGDRVRVVGVSGGRQLVHRLSGLGIVPGSVVTVLRPRGPGLISVNGTRVAVGRQAARTIEVTEIEP